MTNPKECEHIIKWIEKERQLLFYESTMNHTDKCKCCSQWRRDLLTLEDKIKQKKKELGI